MQHTVADSEGRTLKRNLLFADDASKSTANGEVEVPSMHGAPLKIMCKIEPLWLELETPLKSFIFPLGQELWSTTLLNDADLLML